jgi:hypothetical protein
MSTVTHLPGIALPWASLAWPIDASPETAERRSSHADTFSRQGRRVASRPQAARSSGLFPELAALGLPHNPEPTIPESDRAAVDDELLLRVAVVLDVMATATRRLAAGPTILAELTAIAARVANAGATGEEEETAMASLLAAAASEAGDGRAVLARSISERLATAEMGPAPVLSTPTSVAAALRRTEQLAQAVVTAARLLLEAQADVTFRQA